jgi:hypothetical protein
VVNPDTFARGDAAIHVRYASNSDQAGESQRNVAMCHESTLIAVKRSYERDAENPGYGAGDTQSAAVQHRYLQTKFLIVPIGFSELPALAWRSAVFRSAASLGSFFFDGFSAITMAQYVL